MNKLAEQYRWIAGVFCGVLLVGAAQGQVYKWVDSNGVTHYDQKPPEKGKSKEVQMRDNSVAPAAPAAPGNLAEQERAYRQRRVARDEQDAKQAKQRAENESNCKKIGVNIADMRRSPTLYDLNDKGERVYQSDQQREQTIAKQQQEYDQNCK